MVDIKNFILVYDQVKQELVEVLDFEDDMDSAMRVYTDLEMQHLDSDRMDILLVGSDSLETVKVTHANYFTGEAQKQVDELFRTLNLENLG